MKNQNQEGKVLASFKISPTTLRRFKSACAVEGMFMSGVIETFMDDYILEVNEKTKGE